MCFLSFVHSQKPSILIAVFQAIRKLMRETVAVLPQIYHVENAVSLHESERTARVYQQVWEEMGIDLSGYFPTVSANQSAALGRGVSYLMTALTNHITSLKLREVPFENWLYHWRIPDQVAHLDIELTVGQQFGILKDPLQTSLAVQDWRNQFTALKRLKTLRLHCSSQGLYPNEDEWVQTGGPDLYFDDLLTGTSLREDHLQTAITAELESPKHEGIIREADTVVIQTRTFPHLESLTLINCPLRQDGLLYLAAMHRLTLRNVELRRVVFDADPGVASVKGLARSCKLHLPHLRHLVLWKIDLYCPEGDLAGSDAREDVASVYRWDRGEGGGGDGLVRYAWDLERVVEAGVGARSLGAFNVVS